MNGSNEPVWKRPGWITAMVGLVTALLTIPDIVGNYLMKQQDIKLAEVKTDEVKIENKAKQQEQEFKIVNNTLAQQGTERIFILRYLAATLDDEAARDWAKHEVNRLETIASSQKQLAEKRKELVQKEKELNSLPLKIASDKAEILGKEVEQLKVQLAEQDSEIKEMRQKAGISEKTVVQPITTIIELDWPVYKEKNYIKIDLSFEETFSVQHVQCSRERRCQFTTLYVPKKIVINSASDIVQNVSGIADFQSAKYLIPYSCEKNIDRGITICFATTTLGGGF